jgi:hypothetical protein
MLSRILVCIAKPGTNSLSEPGENPNLGPLPLVTALFIVDPVNATMSRD